MSWSAFNGKSGKAAQKDSLSVDENLKLLYSGGLNISLNNIKYPGKSYLPDYGFSAGFLFDYRWNPKSSLRTGLSIERTGYSMRDSSDMFYRYGGEGKMNYFIKTGVLIDYLDLPLLLTFYSGRSNSIYFGFGPYFGWKLNARCTGKAYSISRSGSSYTEILTTVFDDMERLIKGMDVGYIVFGGITIPLGNNYFLDAGLRYRHGSKNVFKGSAEQTYTDSDFKKILNETFTVQTALKVPLFKRVK
jgi:hypothetical protein